MALQTTVEKNLVSSEWLLRRVLRSYEVIDFEAFADCFRPAPGEESGNEEEPGNGEELGNEELPGNVVSFLNHGSMHSLLALLPVLIEATYEHGLQELRPGIMWYWAVKYVPIINRLAKRVSFGNVATSVDEAVEHLKRGRISMYGTMPEGINCVFEFDHPLGPFEKNGLIVVGLKARSKFILCIHKGTESWYEGTRLPLGPRWRKGLSFLLGESMMGARFLRVPRLPEKVDLRVKFVRYEPSITYEEYAAQESAARRRLIAAEAERMRCVMQEEFDRL